MNDTLVFFTNAGYSLCSICICLTILFSYYLKNHEKKIEKSNKCFIYYLFAIIVMSLVELVYVYDFLKKDLITL